MPTESSGQIGRQALRTKARILRTIGDELISNETVALIELVKNAYAESARAGIVRCSVKKG